MKKLSFLIALMFMTMLFSSCKKDVVKGVASSANEEGEVTKIKIISQDVNIRSGCSTNEDVLSTGKQNETYDVVSKVQDWYAVQLPDNQIGFIPEKQCKAVIDPNKKPTPQEATENTSGGQSTTIPNENTGDVNKAKNDQANNSPSLTKEEQEMLDLVNQARAENNLPPLKINMEITNVARIKAQDMIDNNYFSHNSPTYGSPFDMMKSFGIQYVKAGENIAGNSSVKAAHESLMNSPGHRANILNPDYTHIGIGIKSGGQYGNMFTQMFASQPE